MKFIASVSFGRDSLAMLLKILELGYPLDGVLYVELGPEFDCVKKLAVRMQKILEEKKIEFHILRPEIPFEELMLRVPIKYKDAEKGYHQGYGWCGGPCRWGTAIKRDLLHKAYKKYYGNEPVAEYIGIANDETHRINRERDGNRVKLYPLIEWGMSPLDCYDYCLKRGWAWLEEGKDGKVYDLYQCLDRVSCKYCVNKNLKELKQIYLKFPSIWQELKDLQEQIPMPYKKGVSVNQLEDRFKEETRQMSLYDFFAEVN